MDLKELSKLYYIQKLIDRDTQRLVDLEERLQSGVQILTDMPRKTGTKNPIGEIIPLIVDMQQQIVEEQKRLFEEQMKIQQYIDSIHDYQIRLIMYLRFVDLKPWSQVAEEMGGNNTAESIKKVCYRFLRAGKQFEK
ncbi:MAG: hypothetical protein K0R50_417 [Eubacterium sp.]|nr:hypothetical protein [Eubacterium sp.]